MTDNWQSELQKKLVSRFGEKKGAELAAKYSSAFQSNYISDNSVDAALADIEALEKLSENNPLQVRLFFDRSGEDEKMLHLRLFQWADPIPLSDILPMLENMDLRVDNEAPYRIILGKQHIWISDFGVIYKKGVLDLDASKDLFYEAFTKVYLNLAENDGFNKLVLGAGLSWRECNILRAYAKFLRQIRFRFSQTYIERTLVANTEITKDLIALFLMWNDPEKITQSNAQAPQIEEKILKALDAVSSLDEDLILRRMLDLIKATLRTNYFQTAADGTHKPYLCFKFNSRTVPEMPLPVPLYEIFIYSTRFEGIHLRNTKVARGGIRWSDRLEDFRTEILGLMKAQIVKNAIIVPSGAKGGFVLKALPDQASRDMVKMEVETCYKSFIRGLLDITDNIKNNKTISPPQVVCHDDDDPYLVVAADKGTAAFSDVANGLAKEYDFWLGDAFASGGETGYDHKKMGITARGAWESIKRHFLELNIDVLNTPVTVIGVGDMSGDVFGNGMIYSRHLKLIGAFDHRHIFIDPSPDPAASYEERLRLFNLPASSWEDYNRGLISKGGGVFKRSLKSILLTPEMKNVLQVSQDSMTPTELMRAILMAPVDLFFNGGIGTYVKSSVESNAEVGDRANDYIRINGNELRCRVVGEGGNLGFTQLGRIEYALEGDLIYTDFIDNSAGVDSSDHEVNLKILLYSEIEKGKLTEQKRNEILASLTDEVAELVLKDNYNQARVLSYAAYRAVKNMSLNIDYIKELEHVGLNRTVEFLPDDKGLQERRATGGGLTRPELAVLLAYSKIHIKQEILATDLPEDAYLKESMETAFPPAIRRKYDKSFEDHRLRRDIIATQLSNQVINEMGMTFVYRVQIETGASVAEIVRAHAVASRIFGTSELQDIILGLNFKISLQEQYDMLYNIRNLINISTRWFLHYNLKHDLRGVIEHFSQRVQKLEKLIPNLMSGYTKQYLEDLMMKFEKAGLPKETARKIATERAIYTSLNVIDVATLNNFDLEKTARIYFASGERVNLVWFRDQIANDSRDGHWNILARLTLRDELDIAQRALTIAVMKSDSKEMNADELIDHWITHNQRALGRWERMQAMVNQTSNIDYTMFFIAIRELRSLILAGIKEGRTGGW